MAWLNRLNKSIMILRKDFIVVCLFILSIILDSKFAICEKMSSRYTGWVSEGVFTSVDNNTALSECRMSIPTGINPEDVIKVSYSCKSGDYISYFGANNDIIDHGSIVHMDEIQTLRIGCSDGSSFISFGGSKINHYNNTSTGFPIIVTTLSAGFTNSGPGRIPSFVFMEGSFLQLSTFSIKRRVHNIEPTNIRRWTGESFKGGCFALLPISQPGNTIYAIVGMGFVGVGVIPSSLNYLKKGIQIKNMIYKVGSLLSECQTLKGPGLDHKNNSTTYYSVMCPNGHFNKYRTYKKYSFGTTTLASIEVSYRYFAFYS
ncbi:hypothetical protein FG379_000034 [Cryptosporidium bovis]|uniref:uncharacterized protein n=1 Tax=Cryptosporidium bovis TaxID=310047 RepID=UPI003519DF1B|nr:hypothetical protein FG379_000034 [Cryptosporidium bovis]